MLRSLGVQNAIKPSQFILGLLILSMLLSGCAGKEAPATQAEYNASALETKIEAGHNAAFTGWQALYWDFYQNTLAAFQDRITGLGLYHLAGAEVPALAVYSASPSGDSCELYLIEDGEVRCFTGPSRLAAAADPEGPPALLAPASAHALGDLSQMTLENRKQYEPVEYADCIGQYPPPEDWSHGAFFQELRLAEYTVAEAPQYVLLNILTELPIYVEFLQSEFYFAPDGYLYAKGRSGSGLYDDAFGDPGFFQAYYAQVSLHLFITGSLRDRMLALPGLNPGIRDLASSLKKLSMWPCTSSNRVSCTMQIRILACWQRREREPIGCWAGRTTGFCVRRIRRLHCGSFWI